MVSSDRERDYSAIHDYPAGGANEITDSILGNLIEIVELSASDLGGLGIIVMVPGGVVRGLLVGRRRWYKEWISGLKSVGEAGIVGSLLEAIHQSVGKFSEDGSFLDHGATYLHILEGCLVNPQGATNPMPWRIRLDQVSGWSLGEARAIEPSTT